MTTEDLLKPRYKAIADDTSQDFKAGDILTEWKYMGGWVTNVHLQNRSHNVIYNIEKFHHLFKRLQWWEERDLKDLPEYLHNKHIAEGHHRINFQSVFKVTDKVKSSEGFVVCKLEGFSDEFLYSWFIPATKEEYEACQSAINATTLQR